MLIGPAERTNGVVVGVTEQAYNGCVGSPVRLGVLRIGLAFPARAFRMRLLGYSLVGALFAGVFVGGGRTARMAPRSNRLPLVVTAMTGSLLGDRTLLLTGWMQLNSQPATKSDGVDVLELEVAALRLEGASPLGRITVDDRSADGPQFASRGEVRGLVPGAGFPASSFLDLLVTGAAPESPFGSLQFHNRDALRLTPRDTLQGWPPFAAVYQITPVFGVDNDGDGAVDEDTADDDGDGFIDEDRPGTDPDTKAWEECGDDADCDGRDGEDPPAVLCSLALCDADGDGRIDEDPACYPLFGPGETHLKLGLCLRDLTFEVAPLLPSISVARGGPSRLHPADVLGLVPAISSAAAQAPFVRLPCSSLGLSADGCDDGADGDQDDLDALSFGHDLSGPPGALFSVGPGAQGAPGSAVETQTSCPPVLPGAAPEAQPDVFRSDLGGTNELLLDGNGPVGSCQVAFPLGLVEASTARDDLDALDASDASAVDSNGDGVPDQPLYFSLDAASPSLAALGLSPADILVTAGGAIPTAYASADALGLAVGDDIDAVCLRDDGDGRFGPADNIVFSLRAGSPTLTRIGAGPGDLLAPAQPPQAVRRSSDLGLRETDDVDSISCGTLATGPADGDVSCDGRTNSVDAALILQYDAGLTTSFRCPDSADVNADGSVNGLDAAVVLRLEAGLIDRLSVADTSPQHVAFTQKRVFIPGWEAVT